MIPLFEAEPGEDGRLQLPPGVHVATWAEVALRFGTNERRREILEGLLRALQALRAAGCRRAYVDGSFVTSKELPRDFDGCWDDAGVDYDLLDPVLLEFADRRSAGHSLPRLLPARPRRTREGHSSDRPGNPPMITNERQYAITKAQAAKFREALQAEPRKGMHPKALKAMRAGTQSQLEELEEQLAEYEALRSGELTTIKLGSLVDIGPALVKLRIARRLTHKALAERMNLAEQQIQRYEATGYAGVSIERLQAVVDALNVRVNEVLTLEKE